MRHRTSDKPSGIGLLNCYALDEQHRPVERFQREAGLDAMHPIISGAGLVGAVDTVVTFTRSAFLISVNTEPLLFLTAHHHAWGTVGGRWIHRNAAHSNGLSAPACNTATGEWWCSERQRCSADSSKGHNTGHWA